MHIAPRPFIRLAQRSFRLGKPIPRGYARFVGGRGYYLPYRRHVGGALGTIFARWR
jgi:hypothetical protein